MGSNYLLTIGAMLLLSLFILTTNRMIMQNNIIQSESEFVITATSLAQAVLDEIKTKAFDENTVTGEISTPDSLSTTLGKDTGESFSYPDVSVTSLYLSATTFDDIDDYNGYQRTVDTPIAESFSLQVVVSYVYPLNPETSSGTNSRCKLVTVNASSPYISIPISLKYAFTY